jgi:hypothetical protein
MKTNGVWQAERQAMIDHHITHKHEDGMFWSECKCGWASKPRDSNDNYQVTGSLKDGNQHQNQMIGMASNHAMGLIEIT